MQSITLRRPVPGRVDLTQGRRAPARPDCRPTITWRPYMSVLEWSDALALDLPQMDDTHREFVDLLAAVDAAGDDRLLPAWQVLLDHTEVHFGQEDRWMRETRFASGN